MAARTIFVSSIRNQDFNQALNCSPDRVAQGTVSAVRGLTCHFRGEYKQALQDYHSTLICLPQHFITFSNSGLTHAFLKEYQLAIHACNNAIALSPRFGCAYDNRGLAYLGLDNLPQARADFEQGWELDSTHITHGWHVERVRLCQEPPSQEAAQRLDKLVEIGTEHELMHVYIENVCKGLAYWIRGRSGEALGEFDQSIKFESIQWDAYFWKGFVYAAMGSDDEARTAIQAALANNMPPILLAPLRWVKLALYQEFALGEE